VYSPACHYCSIVTKQDLRARLAHVVSTAEDNLWAATYPAKMPPAGLAILGSIRPLQRLGGQAAAEEAARIFDEMPDGYVDVWIHQKAAERQEQGVLAEANRRDVDVNTFDSESLDHLASWDNAQLDPPKPGEEPDYAEQEARAVALAALKHEGLPPELLGKHLLFCRYTFGATRSQPVWLALFEAHGADHLIVINADSDRLLEPVDY
jgi:hypothetical protein